MLADDYILDKVLCKTKEIIRIYKFGNTKLLNDAVDELANSITIAILMASAVENGVIFYPQLLLVSEKESSDINFERLKKALIYI